MTDPRCNCAEPDCPICTAPEHKPWTPKAGVSPDPILVHNQQLMAANSHLMAMLKETRLRAIRRYLLVMLMALLGGMIGGMTSVLTILHYLD